MKRFSLECTKRTQSNYGSDVFKVIFSTELTVGEFIQDIISEERTWGEVIIGDFFKGPRCEYHWGKIVKAIPKEYLDKKIITAWSTGGWGNMDYILAV